MRLPKLLQASTKHVAVRGLICSNKRLQDHSLAHLMSLCSTYLPGNDRKTRSQSREGNPPVDRQAFAHDKTSATRLLEQLSKLAAQRLDTILSHRSAELSRLGPNDPPPYPPPPDEEGIRALPSLNNTLIYTLGRLLLRPLLDSRPFPTLTIS